ncbi:hypothetical protein MHBO_000683 [Bonamia ostreae]|uniref:Ribosomal RNA-processing protein 14/surfeit locus protein 6 C-terminal domain-containing protein n=1 Tax=Bonamia ostreae TaxID=126728 RepID=A0ABV2AHA0_9EUKA
MAKKKIKLLPVDKLFDKPLDDFVKVKEREIKVFDLDKKSSEDEKNESSSEDEILKLAKAFKSNKSFLNERTKKIKKPVDKEKIREKTAMKKKERAKRMKGQSSISTWKSEGEMKLRQQFD